MNEILHKKVSPPFEGGVVGTIDYLIYTVFYFPTGVVDSLISSYLYWYEKQKPGLGFSILRFENRLIFQEPEFVKNEIRKTFKRKDPEFE
jgi:hypothetical protein